MTARAKPGTARRVLGDAPKPADLERALSIYSAIASGGSEEELLYAVVDGPPPSKARPRFGRGRTYTDQAAEAAERATAWRLKQAIGSRGPFTGNVALGCVFYRPNAQRIDTDNMLKHVCDAANGVLWNDDSQVTAIMGVTELDAANPRTVVIVGRHQSTMTRGSDATYPCEVCGKPIPLVSRNADYRRARTCSPPCASRLKGYEPLDSMVKCEQCGEQFRRRTRTQKLCSEECRRLTLTARRKSPSRKYSQCSTCGKQLAHDRGGRCRDCWRADPGGGAASDDRQVVAVTTSKRFTHPGEEYPGVDIGVEELPAVDPLPRQRAATPRRRQTTWLPTSRAAGADGPMYETRENT